MHLTFTANIEILIELSGDVHASPEELLLWLEEMLESQQLTLDEVQQYLTDFNSKRNPR